MCILHHHCDQMDSHIWFLIESSEVIFDSYAFVFESLLKLLIKCYLVIEDCAVLLLLCFLCLVLSTSFSIRVFLSPHQKLICTDQIFITSLS